MPKSTKYIVPKKRGGSLRFRRPTQQTITHTPLAKFSNKNKKKSVDRGQRGRMIHNNRLLTKNQRIVIPSDRTQFVASSNQATWGYNCNVPVYMCVCICVWKKRTKYAIFPLHEINESTYVSLSMFEFTWSTKPGFTIKYIFSTRTHDYVAFIP